MSDSNYTQRSEEAAERALREGLQSPALSPEALQRIRAAAHQEWREAHPALRASPRRWIPVTAAAAITTLALAIGWSTFTMNAAVDGLTLGTVARSDAPGIVETHALRSNIALAADAPLRSGQTFDVLGDSLVRLAVGGNLRVARGTVLEAVAVNAVKLERGELYVDIPPGTRDGERFVVQTRAGEFRHVGTQFAVAIADGRTRLRVREGSVLWRAPQGDTMVDAGTEVTIAGAGVVMRKSIATAGRDWAWVESLAPDFEIEDRPLNDFLEWFSRETGRKLVIADEAARNQAAVIRMHGSVRGLSALEALTAVMAATTLRFELPEGLVRVSSARESTIPTG